MAPACLPANDTGVQRRTREGAQRPTRPSDCNAGLAGPPPHGLRRSGRRVTKDGPRLFLDWVDDSPSNQACLTALEGGRCCQDPQVHCRHVDVFWPFSDRKERVTPMAGTEENMVDRIARRSAESLALERWNNPHQQIVVAHFILETSHLPALAQTSEVSGIRWVEKEIWLHQRLRLSG
jgi:hypothetical protein